MTRLVVVTLGGSAPVTGLDVGVEQGVAYTLIAPDGSRAVINNPSDPDFVGYLTEPPSGIDSPEIRESADLIVEGDGGIHGAFYYGRRPITLTGLIYSDSPVEIINQRIAKLQRAANALRSDGSLQWTPTGGADVELLVRRNAPLRITDRRPKRFMVPLVAADPRIFSRIIHSEAGTAPGTTTLTNLGSTGSPPTITLRDAYTDPVISNFATGEALELDITMVAGDQLVIDGFARTITLNETINKYGALQFPASEWWDVQPGVNSIGISGGTGSWNITWRDAWA